MKRAGVSVPSERELARRAAFVQRITKHGRYSEAEYAAWYNMIKRCAPGSRWAKHYFDAGVRVCERWADSYEAFLEDVGRRPSAGHSLDRIDPAGSYEPGNVRWTTRDRQSRNTKWVTPTGVRGVVEDKQRGGFKAVINVNNRRVFLGRFATVEQAARARADGELMYWGAR